MNENNLKIKSLLEKRITLIAKIKSLFFDGYPEVKTKKTKKYLYIRKRVDKKLTSKYIDIYDDLLYDYMVKTNLQRKTLTKELIQVEKELTVLGYSENDKSISPFITENIFSNIYNQSMLERVDATINQIEKVYNEKRVYQMTYTDIKKVINLKHAWEFITDKHVLNYPTDYTVLTGIARIVNNGLFFNPEVIRSNPVRIGGSTYIPPLPNETEIKNDIFDIVNSSDSVEKKAISLCLYCMKKQIFKDGNKRIAVLFCNHYLISNSKSLLIIDEKYIKDFLVLLLEYYEDKSLNVYDFLSNNCIIKDENNG